MNNKNRKEILTYNSEIKKWCLNFYIHIIELNCGDEFLIEITNNIWEISKLAYDRIAGWHLIIKNEKEEVLEIRPCIMVKELI